MTIKQRIDADLKQAMLSGDKTLATTLRGLKSVILYAEVASGSREEGLSDPTVLELLAKEAKKRQESADLYKQGGKEDMAQAELREKTVIEQYLPAQMSDEALDELVMNVVEEKNAEGMHAMGQVIGEVKSRSGGQADGARIAQAVKKALSS